MMVGSEGENYMMELSKNEAAEVQPRFIRVAEASKMLGIRRTRTYELLNEANGRIKTLVLKSPGAKRGARLIHLPSLFAYLEQLAEKQQKGNQQQEKGNQDGHKKRTHGREPWAE